MASLTDQQLLAVMTSFVNLGVDLSPLCEVFPLFYVIPSSLFRSIFQFLADENLLRPQRRGCVSTWICKSYTPVLIQLPLHRKLSKHLFPGFVLDCHVSVISGLLLSLASTFRGSSLFENSFMSRSLWYPVPARHRPWVSPQSLYFEEEESKKVHFCPVDLSFLDD